MGRRPYIEDVVATVIEGYFECDDEKALPSSPILPPFTLTTVPGPTRWSPLKPHCAIAFSTSCMSSEAGAIASSVHNQQLEPNETSPSPESSHDPVS